MKISIIGSGIAGMAVALRLAHAGHQVEVFEANAYPGGKLTQFTQNGFRFDAGPSLFTLPALVEELLNLGDQTPLIKFPALELEKGCNYFYEDGTCFSAYHSPQKFAEEIQSKLKEDPGQVLDYLKKARFKYEIAAPVFIEGSLHRIRNYLNRKTLRGILNAYRLDLFSTMNEVNERSFSDPHLVQYFNRFATYNGSDPYQAPAILNLIPHLEHGIGTYFPLNGMHQITQTLLETAEAKGVKFHFNQRVNKIEVDDNRQVKGVWLNQTFIASDLVISNMDIHPTYCKLLTDQPQPEKVLKQEKSASAIIFYWGINHSFAELDLHNIFFSVDDKKEFNCIFKQKQMYDDPTVYVNITSKYKKDDAPEGCENWFVMINVPNNQGQNWDQIIDTARKNILAKLSRLLKTEISKLILSESVLDPRSIESKTSSYAGALYGNASNNRYAAFLRHANFSSKIKGLYFCGGSVHPGGGIPLSLNSAKIVAGLIEDDYHHPL